MVIIVGITEHGRNEIVLLEYAYRESEANLVELVNILRAGACLNSISLTCCGGKWCCHLFLEYNGKDIPERIRSINAVRYKKQIICLLHFSKCMFTKN